jgi:hypothetical protein
MATGRIESGQMQVRSVGGAPMQQVQMQQVNPVGYQAQASTAEALSRVLDRMGQTAFTMAGEQQQQRAFADVVNNPISPEQIEAAKNGDVSTLKLGGNINVYDVAMRKARSFELSSRFETEAKNEAVKIMADIDAGNMNSVQAAEKMNVLTNGYAKSLAGVDAEAALKFTASMGIYGSTVVAKAYEQEVKKRKEREALAVLGDFDNSMKLVQPMLEQGVYTNSRGEMRPTTDLVDVARKNLTDRAFAAGGIALAREYQTKFDAEVRQAKINVIAKQYTGEDGLIDVETQLRRLKAGDAGKVSHVLQEMIATDFDSVAKVEAQIMSAAAHRYTVRQQKEAEDKRAGEAQAVGLLTKIYALPEGSAERRRLSGQLATVAQSSPGSVPMGVLKDVLAPNQDSNAQVQFNVLQGIFDGRINSADQIWSQVGKGLSGKDAVGALKILNSEERRDIADLERGLAKLAGINVIPGQAVIIDKSGVEAKRLNDLRGQAGQLQAARAAEGKPPMTSREVLQTVEADIMKRRDSEAARSARQQLEVYEKQEWVNGKITRDGLVALEKKAGNDRNKQNAIKRMRQLLDQSEGN